MEKVKLRNVLLVSHQGPERVTRDYCEERAPHYPHLVTAMRDGERYIPISKTVCPGSSGAGIWIYTAKGTNWPTWLIIDRDEDRWRPWLERRVSSEWIRIYYEELEAGRYYYEGTPDYCGSTESHHPHVVGIYDTRRWGSLQVFCPGLRAADWCIYESLWQDDICLPVRAEYLIVGD